MFKRIKAILNFYCRWTNRRVTACPHDDGASHCPLRVDCPAYTGEAEAV